MTEARQSESWNHTSATLAMQANTAFGRKRKSISPLEFHPFANRQSKRRLTKQETKARLNAMIGLKDGKSECTEGR